MNNIEAAEILEKAIRCVRSDSKACTERCNDCVHYVPTKEGVEALTIAIKTLKEKED